jgi:hypothetical protein
VTSFYFPNIVKFKKKRFWSSRSENELTQAKRECVAAHSKINYFNLLEKCNLFTITERLKFKSLLNVFKLKKFGCKVLALSKLFPQYVLTPTFFRKTRNYTNCIIVPHNSSIFENSNLYFSSYLWNTLPKEFCDFEDVELCFPSSITKWLLDKTNAIYV